MIQSPATIQDATKHVRNVMWRSVMACHFKSISLGLREDLFVIRDELWDRAREEGNLDHESHRQFRDVINSLIRIAPVLTFFTFFRIILVSDSSQEVPLSDQLTEVEEARRKVITRLVRYLLRETLVGFMASIAIWILCYWILIPTTRAVASIDDLLRRFLASKDLKAAGSATMLSHQSNSILPLWH